MMSRFLIIQEGSYTYPKKNKNKKKVKVLKLPFILRIYQNFWPYNLLFAPFRNKRPKFKNRVFDKSARIVQKLRGRVNNEARNQYIA